MDGSFPREDIIIRRNPKSERHQRRLHPSCSQLPSLSPRSLLLFPYLLGAAPFRWVSAILRSVVTLATPAASAASAVLLSCCQCLLDRAQPYRFYFQTQIVRSLIGVHASPPSARAFICIDRAVAVAVAAVVLTLSHRCEQLRGHDPGSNRSGVEGHLAKIVPKTPSARVSRNAESLFFPMILIR